MFLFLCPKGFSIFVLHKFSLCFYQVFLKSVRVCVYVWMCVCVCILYMFCLNFRFFVLARLRLFHWDNIFVLPFFNPLPNATLATLAFLHPFFSLHLSLRPGWLHSRDKTSRAAWELGERAASSFTFGHFIVIAEIPSMALAIFVPFKFYFIAYVAAHGNCDPIVFIDASLIYSLS